jgi:tetratricopeptide (TPR) repeat protein
VYYDYGTDVVYRDDVVYVDDEEQASADEYYQQALALAQAIPEMDEEAAAKIDWLPLGLFTYAGSGGSATDSYLQLAVSKEGYIGGTYFNEATDISRPIQGTVDRTTQRAAWGYADGENTEIVMETTASNLTKDRASVLLHFGPSKNQRGLLIRLNPPSEAEQDKKANQWLQLAENYQRAGMKDKAAEYAKKVIDTYPESGSAEKAKAILAE